MILEKKKTRCPRATAKAFLRCLLHLFIRFDPLCAYSPPPPPRQKEKGLTQRPFSRFDRRWISAPLYFSLYFCSCSCGFVFPPSSPLPCIFLIKDKGNLKRISTRRNQCSKDNVTTGSGSGSGRTFPGNCRAPVSSPSHPGPSAIIALL